MSKPLDYLVKYPSLWLGVYCCGSIMTIATIAQLLGAAAASSAAGFLILAGTFGYETLTRRETEKSLFNRLFKVEKEQSRITREVSKTRSDINHIKDDIARKNFSMKKRETDNTPDHEKSDISHKTQPPSLSATSFLSTPVKKTPKASKTFFYGYEAANIDPIANKAQKYKDLLEASQPANEEDSIPHFSNDVITEMVHQAIQNDKIEIFAQPIVRLPSRRLQFMELFARIRARPGLYLSADTYRPLAEQETLLESVDHILLLHAIDNIRADKNRDMEIGYFLNISSRSLKDQFYMNDLLEFLRFRRDLSERLIFEIQHQDFLALSPAMKKVLQGLVMIGCKFSVDNILAEKLSIEELAKSGFSFAKFKSSYLVDMSTPAGGDINVMRLKSDLDASGIILIVEKIESEHDLRELLDFEIDFGEGFLFGRPDLEMTYRHKMAA